MRQDCVHFESRTYPSGETVRRCNLDLAPEAPWRCPPDCPSFAKRTVDVGWSYGTLVTPSAGDEPEGEGIADLLGEAEEIINAASSEALAELEQERARNEKRRNSLLGRLKAKLRRSEP
jgi:hypothetical protein